jgi:hypothetical protein
MSWELNKELYAMSWELNRELSAMSRELNRELCAISRELNRELSAMSKELNKELCAMSRELNRELCQHADYLTFFLLKIPQNLYAINANGILRVSRYYYERHSSAMRRASASVFSKSSKDGC